MNKKNKKWINSWKYFFWWFVAIYNILIQSLIWISTSLGWQFFFLLYFSIVQNICFMFYNNTFSWLQIIFNCHFVCTSASLDPDHDDAIKLWLNLNSFTFDMFDISLMSDPFREGRLAWALSCPNVRASPKTETSYKMTLFIHLLFHAIHIYNQQPILFPHTKEFHLST